MDINVASTSRVGSFLKMEDLLQSLRNLGLKPPDPTQLLELLEEDGKVQERLARIISLNSVSYDLDANEDGSSINAGMAALMGQDLLQEAVTALLDNFRKSLKRQQQVSERERKAERKKVKWPPRKALLARHEAALKRLNKDKEENPDYRPKLIFDGTISYYSTSELHDLKQIMISDLDQAPRRYQGRYLLCRVLTSLLLYAGVTFIAEDSSGSALPISVSHFTSNINMTTEEVSKFLPIGSIIAIREPFVSLDHQSRAGPCNGKADVGIRIDSPTDIVISQAKEARAAFLTEISNGHIMTPDWLTTCQAEVVDPLKLLGSVQHLLKQDRPGEAYRAVIEAKRVGMAIDPMFEGTVAFRLDLWNIASTSFERAEHQSNGKVNSFHDDDNRDTIAAADFSLSIAQLTAKQARIRCEMRIEQSLHGPTSDDMKSIYFAAANGVRHLDTSDFIGPVAVKEIPGAGRGLVTTRAVKAGELLLFCKAVCPAYSDDEECIGSPLMRLNLENGIVSTTSQIRAQTKLIHAVVDRPELAAPILGLTAGPTLPHSPYVAQDYPLRTTFDADADDEKQSHRLDIDAGYIDGVLRFNAFGPAQVPSRRGFKVDGELHKSTMPHPLPAILNHACLPNVSSVFLSNIVTTRALSYLPAGCEIVHQYVRGEEPYAIRTANLSKHGFECACRLCILDRKDGMEQCQKRARIVQGESKAVLDRSAILLKTSLQNVMDGNAHANEEAHEDIIEALDALIARIDATYSVETRGIFRPDLFTAMDARTRHLARKDVDKALESAREALSCVGATVNLTDEQRPLSELPKLHFDPSLALMLFIATLLAKNGAMKHSKSWTSSAFRAHECMIGGGLDVFLDRWDLEEYKIALELQWPTK